MRLWVFDEKQKHYRERFHNSGIMRKSDKYAKVKKIAKNVQKNWINYEEMCYKCWKRVAKADVGMS